MSKPGDRGKDAERRIAKVLQSHGLTAERVKRGDDFGRSDTDVKVKEFPQLQIDSKHRARWSHHTFAKEVEKKYCKEPDDIPILITHEKGKPGQYVTMKLEHWAKMLGDMGGNTGV